MLIKKNKQQSLLTSYHYQKAFTILELIVVFFFFALLSGLALPNLSKAYDSWQRNLGFEDLLLNINRLSISAIETNRIIILSNTMNPSELPFSIPQNWQIILLEPIYYYPNGVCSGGSLILKNGNIENQYDLQAPYCTPKKI